MNIITDLVAKNLATFRSKRTIRGIVLHDTAGSGKHGDTIYLANDPENRGISVDFTVERDGKIYQLNPNPLKFFTSHAGRATKFRGFVNAQVNRVTLGIEIVQKANLSLLPIWPLEQVTAVAELCAHLCKTYNLTKDDITTHQLIITDGSRTDPRKWPFQDFWSYFNDFARRNAPELAGKIKHTVALGDTLYALARTYGTTIEKLKALNNMNYPSNEIMVGQILAVKE